MWAISWTFQQDGTFEMAGINGSFTTAKFRVDLKQVGFTFDDGKKRVLELYVHPV